MRTPFSTSAGFRSHQEINNSIYLVFHDMHTLPQPYDKELCSRFARCVYGTGARLIFRVVPSPETQPRHVPGAISQCANRGEMALQADFTGSGRRAPQSRGLRSAALTGFPLHPGSVRLGVFRSSMVNSSADPLVHRRVAICVQNNFHPVPSTKLCEQSGNMVHDHVLGNLQLRGNLIVRQTDRDKAYQLFVFVITIHITIRISYHYSYRQLCVFIRQSAEPAPLYGVHSFHFSVREGPLERNCTLNSSK